MLAACGAPDLAKNPMATDVNFYFAHINLAARYI
jgi:hypothetical protein